MVDDSSTITARHLGLRQHLLLGRCFVNSLLAVTQIVSPKAHCVNVAIVELLSSNSGGGASSGREELLCDGTYVCYGARSADL
jgi:hypothetical protein